MHSDANSQEHQNNQNSFDFNDTSLSVTSTSSSETLESNSCSKSQAALKSSSKRTKHYHKLPIPYRTSNQIGDKKLSSIDLTNEQTFPMYITSIQDDDDFPGVTVTLDKMENATKDIILGKHCFKTTPCGLIGIFTDQNDADRFLKLDLAKIFGGPIQVATLNSRETRYRRFVTIKNVPWCIWKSELENALKIQGIDYGEIIRNKNQVRVEVLNACHVDRLRNEGLNFYNCATFTPVFVDFLNEEPALTSDVMQCYKCQGFWHTANHCHNEIRCVRCGDYHNVECCPRPKTNPLCCNCGGNHHAAYKLCPFKLQLQNSVRLAFSLTGNKPHASSFIG